MAQVDRTGRRPAVARPAPDLLDAVLPIPLLVDGVAVLLFVRFVRPLRAEEALARGRAVVKLVPSSELKPAKKAALAREDVAVAMARLIDPAVFAAWAGKGVTVVVP